MSIWFNTPHLNDLAQRSKGTAIESLGIEFTEIGDDFLKGRMPVDHRTKQPMGLLHGGASVLLAETLGSMATATTLDPEKQWCAGQEINANHVRAVRSGWVHGIARPLHRGASSQIWEIHIHNEQEQLVCVSRITMAILNRR